MCLRQWRSHHPVQAMRKPKRWPIKLHTTQLVRTDRAVVITTPTRSDRPAHRLFRRTSHQLRMVWRTLLITFWVDRHSRCRRVGDAQRYRSSRSLQVYCPVSRLVRRSVNRSVQRLQQMQSVRRVRRVSGLNGRGVAVRAVRTRPVITQPVSTTTDCLIRLIISLRSYLIQILISRRHRSSLPVTEVARSLRPLRLANETRRKVINRPSTI